MRIEQLDYLEKIIKHGSINLAAKELFLTQPTLSNAVKDLEQEMGIQLLIRSKKGVVLTDEGRRFMVYANQVLAQVKLLEGQYKEKTVKKKVFAVSAQHYAFVVHAFVELIKNVETEEYQFTLRETATEKILTDVMKFRSDLGILYLNSFNQEIMKKLFKEHDLEFTPLFTASPHVFLSRDNPLTLKKSLSLADLEDYPYLSYEQGDNNSFYFSEEILSTISHKKSIKVTDRATIFNLMVGLNGYTISSGIISSELNDDKIVAIPLEVDDYITLGWLKHKQVKLSEMSLDYLERLKEHIIGFGFKII
ncbi:LysR family transcriptional regulator [Vagococcus fluvialis]|uniref:LysR family transcriptional regulator n=1 Tax=Vagococcus fluvialis TaxID=2738 RepID=A0A7X6D835_9ENTE|nr:LysR family transcriptional regulator [Vagococcus fluvialis]MBO0430092.1 LysR family transcriptional regulator [Vagococcus fluvialis]MBO0436319.1 LysR family transcriptional regulator [Vagococcus fluvialis]MBO0478693.1 LysR family transcriptional regulator [Vagococcus fluvialis]MBO0484462.1 LysR family transcriptional regulator [Vagococcus fluvialis]NKC58354.1 LysR family transcriptional regulator [Vagococcus fluvialis]